MSAGAPRYARRVAGLALLSAPMLACAAGGIHVIDKDCVANGCFAGDNPGFPVTISTAGSYVLGSDLVVNTAGATAIQVNASPVDLDLGQHTISGGGSCSGSPVTSCSSGAGSLGIAQSSSSPAALRIHDGTIRGFTHTPGIPFAIYLGNAGDGTVVERVSVLESGGASGEAVSVSGTAAATVLVRDAHVARNQYLGIACRSGNGATLVMRNSEVSANGGHSVQVSFCNDASISGSRFYGNGLYAIYGIAATVELADDTFATNNGAGTQYSVTNVIDAGGNACFDHACP